MTEPNFTQLRAFNAAVGALIADRDVTDDLLLIGLWLARAYHLRQPAPGEGRWSFKAIAHDVYGPGTPYTITGMGVTHHVSSQHVAKVKRALTDDIPRYDRQRDNEGLWHPFGGYECAAPMIRREGLCGQHATESQDLTDLATGRIHVLAACTRHRPWLNEQYLRNRDDVRAAGEHLPAPVANAGGLLARHLPKVGWQQIWTHLRPGWTPPPQGTPVGKPRLTVLALDEADLELAPDVAAPALRLIAGGWTA
jgi:hypothetical protein